MKPPVTYAEWMACLDSIRSDGPEIETLEAMSQGTISWTTGIAEGITSELTSVIEFRLKRCTELLQRDIGVRALDSSHTTRCLLDARRRIDTARRIASLRPLPDYVRTSLEQSVSTWADRCQASLEDSARNDRTGNLLVSIRRTPLNRLPSDLSLSLRHSEPISKDLSGVESPCRPGRRIILK